MFYNTESAMRALKLIMPFGGIMLTGLGWLMVITNPGQQDYEVYAVDTLTIYLKQEVCPQAAAALGGILQSYCKTLVDTGRPHIGKIIANRTRRENYLLFSIYETEIALPSPIPSYQFETIGAFQQFYTYQAEAL